ncbi:Virulence-associated protein E [Filimonas lacunae]|uniref:Virulence-associated protein E n=1 Tax=Filimonas lacunae TaxID=477680 RepID=A0A173MFG2_9BACT|nr:VapE domain-containing protein [Filimonas lacunae]BAV06171.1 helicase [Filimonas lacunae]SIT25066.1 Virulence-associated protein E [Filimonas lacunae]
MNSTNPEAKLENVQFAAVENEMAVPTNSNESQSYQLKKPEGIHVSPPNIIVPPDYNRLGLPDDDRKTQGAARPVEQDNTNRIKAFLNQNWLFRYNTLSNIIEVQEKNIGIGGSWKSLDEMRLNSMKLRMAHEMGLEVDKKLRIILRSDFVKQFNAIEDYFNSLPVWDRNTDYIAGLANTVTTTNQPAFLKYFRKWFVGLVACCLNPNASNHLVFLLKGAQGIGKTKFLRNLMPPELKNYCNEAPFNPGSKGNERLLAENMLIILDEFDIKSDKQMDLFKFLVTCETVNAKRAYSNQLEQRPRIASFAGTTNRSSFLNDETGTRRFFVAEAIDISPVPYEHLSLAFAQAYALVQDGEQYYLSGTDIEELNALNSEHIAVNVEEECLLKCVAPANVNMQDRRVLSATEITEYLCKHTPLKFSNAMVQKIGVLLKRNGFAQRKSNGRPVYDVICLM